MQNTKVIVGKNHTIWLQLQDTYINYSLALQQLFNTELSVCQIVPLNIKY